MFAVATLWLPLVLGCAGSVLLIEVGLLATTVLRQIPLGGSLLAEISLAPLLLSKVLRHGLSAAGRFLAFRCRLPDRPGALATLLMELASLGANVLDVVH